jgi:type III pantothenate kinase
MILALDIGNSQIHGGVFTDSSDDQVRFQFRKNTKNGYSSDEVGLFLRAVLRENGLDPDQVTRIAICSVVPDVVHSIRNACLKYFDLQPFMLQPGVKTGLSIKYRNPLEVGADRIANAIAGTQLFPGKDLIIVDFGTATTFDVVTANKEYLGGMILPGLRISMEALELRTAKLPSVEIVKPEQLVGRSTVESIQAGLFYSNLFALKGISEQIKRESFERTDNTVLIGTGGFSRLFEKQQVFDTIVPELILLGLHRALQLNPG